MMRRRNVEEEKMIEMIGFVLKSGFNIRQVLSQTNQKGYNEEDAPRTPPILGAGLLVALE